MDSWIRDRHATAPGHGASSSPTFVPEPEVDGAAERFIRTLKENLLWVRHVANSEALRQALQEFRRLYNGHWLIEPNGHRYPAEVRAHCSHRIPAVA